MPYKASLAKYHNILHLTCIFVLPFQKIHDPFTKEHKMTTFTLKLLLFYTQVYHFPQAFTSNHLQGAVCSVHV